MVPPKHHWKLPPKHSSDAPSNQENISVATQDYHYQTFLFIHEITIKLYNENQIHFEDLSIGRQGGKGQPDPRKIQKTKETLQKQIFYIPHIKK